MIWSRLLGKLAATSNWKWQKRSLHLLVLAALFIVFTFTWFKPIGLNRYGQHKNLFLDFSHLKSKEWYFFSCFDGRLEKAIGKISVNLQIWSQAIERDCQVLWSKFQDIYTVDVKEGHENLTKQFAAKVRGWLGENESLFSEFKNQTVISVFNKYNFEQTLYNPLRSKRPVPKPAESPRDYVNKLAKETQKSCDFCNYKIMTSYDELGRIEGEFSMSTANAFKLDKWHGLFLTKKHNPLDIIERELVDLFNTSLKWFHKVHSFDSAYRLPNIIWDSLPHAGASQVHPHMHGLMGKDQYFGLLNVQYAGAETYGDKTGSKYWSDFLEIHYALGLAVKFGNAFAVAPLTSRKDHEILLLSDMPSRDLFRLLYYVVDTYHNKLNVLCYSAGMAFPAVGVNKEGSLPALIRIGSRGDCSSVRSDTSSLELYLVNNVNVDPYMTMKEVGKAIAKHVPDY